MSKYKNQTGFTLLELVVVVAILGLVTSMATTYVVEQATQNRIADTDSRRDVLREAINRYYLQNGNTFPANLVDLVDATKPGYPYLLEVDFEECDDSGAVKSIPVYRDGWGNGYNLDSSTSCTDSVFTNFGWEYVPSDVNVAGEPSLYSKGLDGASKYPNVDFPITTAAFAGAGAAALEITASGATSTITCKQSGSSVSMALCLP